MLTAKHPKFPTQICLDIDYKWFKIVKQKYDLSRFLKIGVPFYFLNDSIRRTHLQASQRGRFSFDSGNRRLSPQQMYFLHGL